MTLLRRSLVVVALMFWQGGFTFYAAVVVPIGQANLGHQEQGILITREVAHYLNLAGAAALILLAWDMVECAGPTRLRAWCRWFAWAAMLGTLVALIWLHPHLERLLDVDARGFLDSNARRAFHPRHRLYLWLSTVQWACALAYTILTLQTWRVEDRASGSVHGVGPKPGGSTRIGGGMSA